MMPLDVLKTADTGVCDRFAARQGAAGFVLMQAAGEAVAAAILARWAARPVLVLCGPGKNGGDGYVCAWALQRAGWPVRIASLGDPAALEGDAARARALWHGPVEPLSADSTANAELIVDALFGAGLNRPMEGVAAELAGQLAERAIPVVAIDLPSGIAGDRACGLGAAFRADLTVSFHRPKPAHCLEPAATACGELVIADIGIPDGWQALAAPVARLNSPELWIDALPRLAASTHKHRRGHLVVFSGGAASTGAARLSALTGLRAGAGLVTLASPPSALLVNAAAATAVMVHRWEREGDTAALLWELRASACVIGPAAGVGEATRRAVLACLSHDGPVVLDADALTSVEADPEALFASLRASDVLTPHIGEFERLFPGLLAAAPNKLEAVNHAAERAGCVVLLKGPDTVIASIGHTSVINRHANPVLATAGSGDVLAGLIGGLLAQGVAAFDAACAGAWMHGDAGLRLGQGVIAEDLPGAVPAVLQALSARAARAAARARLDAVPR
jgi:NAD(P)H-hydrate epimerase